jgi:hypothetical protein
MSIIRRYPPFSLANKIAQPEIQRTTDSRRTRNRQPTFTAFYQANGSPMKAGLISENFQGPASGLTQMLDVTRQG